MIGFIQIGLPRCSRAGISLLPLLLLLLSLPALVPGPFAARQSEEWSEDWWWQQ